MKNVAHISVTLWKVVEVCGVCVPHGQWVVHCVIRLVVLCNRIVRNGSSASTLQSFIPIVVFVVAIDVCGCGGRGGGRVGSGGGMHVLFASFVWLFIFNSRMQPSCRVLL